MTHPDVLVEEDYEQNRRWITVNGRHFSFYGADEPIKAEHDNIPPSDLHWERYMDELEEYTHFKRRLAGEGEGEGE